MSVTVELSERQLRVGVVKLAVSLAGFFALAAVGLALLVGGGQSIAIDALFVSLSFLLLTNGFLALLKIIDWFEDRKRWNG